MQFLEQGRLRDHKHIKTVGMAMNFQPKRVFSPSLRTDVSLVFPEHMWENQSRLFPGQSRALQLQLCGSFTGPSATWKDTLFEKQGCISPTAHQGSKPNRSKSAGVL